MYIQYKYEHRCAYSAGEEPGFDQNRLRMTFIVMYY